MLVATLIGTKDDADDADIGVDTFEFEIDIPSGATSVLLTTSSIFKDSP
jgi:hypothetical protein